jgi:hypothetical protein
VIFTTKVHKDFHIIWLSNTLALSVPDEGYIRKALFSRNKKISTILFCFARSDRMAVGIASSYY